MSLDLLMQELVNAATEKVLAKLPPPTNSSTNVTKRLMSTRQVAVYLSASMETVRNLAAANKLPIVQVGDRKFRFDKLDIDKWIEERKGYQYGR